MRMLPGLRIGATTCLGLALLTGCSSRADARGALNAPTEASADPRTGHPSPPTSTAGAAVPPVHTPAAPDAATPPPPPQADPKTGEVPGSLPELKLSLVGMHIGGGPNDAETKRPFIEAIEKGFTAMRSCYSEVEDPAKGGTFGVDLRVDRIGGRPSIQALRTVMKGERFKTCVQQAFEGLEFSRPSKPTVLSASVQFILE